MSTTIQIRIDKKTKDQARKVLAKLGLDLSSSIKLFLTQVINSDSIPFTPTIDRNISKIRKKRIQEEVSHAKKCSKRFKSVESLIAYILNDFKD